MCPSSSASSQQHPAAPQHPWAGLYILAIAVFAVITTEVVPIGLLPQVVADFGVDEARGGLLVTLYAALVAITAIPLTRATGSLPRKPVLLSTLVVFTVSNTLAALAQDFWWLMAARAVGGVAHALFFAIAIGYAARIAPRGQIGRAMALLATGTSAGLILGVPAGTALGALTGWRPVFAALGLITALAVAAAAFLLPAISHDKSAARALLPGGPTLLLVVGLAGSAFLGHYTLYTYVSPLLLAAGLPQEWLGLALVALGVAGLIAIRATAPFLDAQPFRWLLLVPLAIGLGLAATGLAFPHFWPVLIVATVWVAAFGPVNSTYQNVLVRVGKSNPEMAGAWINVSANIGIGAGSALGGWVVVTSGYSAAAWVGAAILLATLLLTLLFRQRLRAVR